MNKLRTVVGVVMIGAFAASFAVPAQADPDAVAEAKEALEKIQADASALDQEIIEASDRADEAATKLESLTGDLAAQEAKVDQMANDLGEIAALTFQTQGLHVTAQLITSGDDASFLNSLATIQNETDRSNAQIQAFQVEQARLDELRDDADATNTSLQNDLKAKEELASDYEAKAAEAEAVYDRLNAEEQERLRQLELERQRQQEEADRQAAEEAAASDDSSDSSSNNSNSSSSSESSSNDTTSNVTSSGSSRGEQAAQIALAQVGKSYVWGTSGPNTFDCSGLTSYAYRQVGINLTRSSRGQAGLGTPVSKSNLQPGDLVFYYSPISHVGIYIGNGKIVHAANPRSGVQVASLNLMPYSGARRVA
ncbi:MAG: NlpC/P60 family protein [Arachnia sp.]